MDPSLIFLWPRRCFFRELLIAWPCQWCWWKAIFCFFDDIAVAKLFDLS